MMIRQEKAKTARNLEVGQRVGDSENPEEKGAGHGQLIFCKDGKIIRILHLL
jgi:hypothetical protein